jgi:hypothetical protein
MDQWALCFDRQGSLWAMKLPHDEDTCTGFFLNMCAHILFDASVVIPRPYFTFCSKFIFTKRISLPPLKHQVRRVLLNCAQLSIHKMPSSLRTDLSWYVRMWAGLMWLVIRAVPSCGESGNLYVCGISCLVVKLLASGLGLCSVKLILGTAWVWGAGCWWIVISIQTPVCHLAFVVRMRYCQ